MRKVVTNAMVLAAGKGTRLRPLTDEIPKPLCELAGVPLIRLTLRQLYAAGVRRAVVNLHHLGERIAGHLGQRAEGIELVFSREERILGTGGGIRAALPQLGDDPFFVINSDAVQDVDLAALAAAHFKSVALATLALRADPDVKRFGALGIRGDGSVGRILDLVDDGQSTALRMFTGVHLMDRRTVEHLPLGEESCVIRQAYVPHLQAGARLQAFEHRGAFHDVGTPERWSHAHRAVLGGGEPKLLEALLGGRNGWRDVGGGAWVHDGASVAAGALTGPCLVHAGAAIEAGAAVGPFVSLGAGARVASGARVQQAAVLGGTVVGPEEVVDVIRWPGGSMPWPWPAT